MRTSQKTLEAIATIGVDLGKNTFHLVGLDKRDAIVLQQKVYPPGGGRPRHRPARGPTVLWGVAFGGGEARGRQDFGRHSNRTGALRTELLPRSKPGSRDSDTRGPRESDGAKFCEECAASLRSTPKDFP